MTQYRKPIPKNQSEITQEALGSPYLSNEGKPVSDTIDRKSTRLNSSHSQQSRMPSSA